MAGLADAVGVSRQTVYNEVGSKPALADAMVREELAGFLAVVEHAFDGRPDDAVAALRAAVRAVLQRAQGHALLHAIVSATHGADTELLPLLTSRSDSLLDAANAVLLRRLAPVAAHVDARELRVIVDAIVRVVLSHVMRPSGPPSRTAADVAWLASRLLGEPESATRGR